MADTFQIRLASRIRAGVASGRPWARTPARGIRNAAAKRLASASAAGRLGTWCSPCSTRWPSSCAASKRPRSPVLPVAREGAALGPGAEGAAFASLAGGQEDEGPSLPVQRERVELGVLGGQRVD